MKAPEPGGGRSDEDSVLRRKEVASGETLPVLPPPRKAALPSARQTQRGEGKGPALGQAGRPRRFPPVLTVCACLASA